MACWVFTLAMVEILAGFTRRQKRHSATGNGRRPPRAWRSPCVGIAFSQNYSVERDVRMRAGDSDRTSVKYRFSFQEVKEILG